MLVPKEPSLASVVSCLPLEGLFLYINHLHWAGRGDGGTARHTARASSVLMGGPAGGKHPAADC